MTPRESPFLVDLDRQPDLDLPLWGEAPPGGPAALNERLVHRDNPFGLSDRAAHDVTRPILSMFKPVRPNGAALLIIPGGGYSWVVVDKEGFEGARYFVRSGFTVYVLRYRLPHQGWAGGADTPLQDAQRAARIIRARAAIDGTRGDALMVMGFSAGGHLAGSLAARFAEPVYQPRDAADDLSARPDAAVLVYPVATMQTPFAHPGSRRNLLGAAPDEPTVLRYSLETAPPRDTPPTLLLHAADDAAVPVENSLDLFAALRRASVPAALHVFEQGGHGFGLRGLDGAPRAAWPKIATDWAASHGRIRG